METWLLIETLRLQEELSRSVKMVPSSADTVFMVWFKLVYVDLNQWYVELNWFMSIEIDIYLFELN